MQKVTAIYRPVNRNVEACWRVEEARIDLILPEPKSAFGQGRRHYPLTLKQRIGRALVICFKGVGL